MAKNPNAEFRPWFVPLDQTQEKAVVAFERSRILIILGGPGSGKTHVAVALALTYLAMDRVDKILLTRPNVECGPSLGFMPGDPNEKMSPWMGAIRDVLDTMSFLKFEELPFEVVPLQHIRGRNVRKSIALLDEAQNATDHQLDAILTRLCEGGKIVLCGDPDFQSDVGRSPLLDMVEDVKGLDGLEVVRLCGQHRDPLVSAIVKRRSERHRGNGLRH